MSIRRAPPPTSSAPASSMQALEVVKKKTAPLGSPPPGMMINFSGPKKVERPTNNCAQSKLQNYEDDDDEEIDDYKQEYNKNIKKNNFTSNTAGNRPEERDYRRSADENTNTYSNNPSNYDPSHNKQYNTNTGNRSNRNYPQPSQEEEHNYLYEDDAADNDYPGRINSNTNHPRGGYPTGQQQEDQGDDSYYPEDELNYDNGQQQPAHGDSLYRTKLPPATVTSASYGYGGQLQGGGAGAGKRSNNQGSSYQDDGPGQGQGGQDSFYDAQDEDAADQAGYQQQGYSAGGGYRRNEDADTDYTGQTPAFVRVSHPAGAGAVNAMADGKETTYLMNKHQQQGYGKGYKDTTATAIAGPRHPSAPPMQQMQQQQQLALPQPYSIATANAANGNPALAGNGKQPSSAQTQQGRVSIFNFQPVLKSTYRELRSFVNTPCQGHLITRCYIERNRSGSQRLAPYYSLCADLEDGTGRELIVCRKVMQSFTSHYVFSLKAEDLYIKRDQRSKLYLGKLRQVTSNSYVLYDNGIAEAPEDPDGLLEAIEQGNVSQAYNLRDTAISRKKERDSKASHSGMTNDEVSLYRKELAVIHFNSKVRPSPQGVRGMEVCIPAVNPATQQALMAGADSKTSGSSSSGSSATVPIFNIYKAFDKIRATGRQNDLYGKSCIVLHEKSSRYDPLSACLVEFKGRAHMASIKNFQLVVSDPLCAYQNNLASANEEMLRRDGEKEFVFQMGKTTEDCFNMDYRYPMSLLQSFAISIARFDAKLTW